MTTGQNIHMLRDIPRKTMAGILLAFVVLVALHVWVDARSGHLLLNADVYYHMAYITAFMEPETFRLDPVFGSPVIGEKAFSAYPWFLLTIWYLSKYLSFYQVFMVLQPVFGLAYLLAAFYVLFKITGRPIISAFVAYLSGRFTPVFPTDQWGALSIRQVAPAASFLFLAPLFFYAWLRFQHEPKKRLLVFLGLGAAGAVLHPLSWYAMTGAMLLAQVFQERFSRSAFKDAFLCGLVSLLPMLPFLVSFFSSSGGEPFEPTGTEFIKLVQGIGFAFKPVNPMVLLTWPDGIAMTFGWIVLAGWAGFKLRGKIDPLLYYFAMSCLILFGLFYLVNFGILVPMGILPKEINAFRTLRYIMLPVMVMVALWLSMFSGKRLLARMILTLVLIAGINFQLLYRDITHTPLAVSDHWAHQWQAFLRNFGPFDRKLVVDAEWAAVAMAKWLKENTIAEEVLVHVGDRSFKLPYMVRGVGRRSVTFSLVDGGLLYYHNKPYFLYWLDLCATLFSIRQQYGDCSRQEAVLARKLGATHFVCPSIRPVRLPVEYRNPYFSVYRLAKTSSLLEKEPVKIRDTKKTE